MLPPSVHVANNVITTFFAVRGVHGIEGSEQELFAAMARGLHVHAALESIVL